MIADELVRSEQPTASQELWERALRDDSNLALDWLWLAQRVDGEKRSYSLLRAGLIDPQAIRRLRDRSGRVATLLWQLGLRRACDPCI